MEKRNKPQRKWLPYVIAVLVGCLLATGIFLIEVYALGRSLSEEVYLILLDAFGVSGAILSLAYLFALLHGAGAFDLFSYSGRLFFYTVFHPASKERPYPKSYADFREEKKEKKRAKPNYLLYTALAFLVISLVLYIPYSLHRPGF